MTTETDATVLAAKTAVLDAALAHVPFDGWSDTTFRAAIAASGVDPALARALFPRGAVDLALAFHRRGDDAMVARLAATRALVLGTPRQGRGLPVVWFRGRHALLRGLAAAGGPVMGSGPAWSRACSCWRAAGWSAPGLGAGGGPAARALVARFLLRRGDAADRGCGRGAC